MLLYYSRLISSTIEMHSRARKILELALSNIVEEKFPTALVNSPGQDETVPPSHTASQNLDGNKLQYHTASSGDSPDLDKAPNFPASQNNSSDLEEEKHYHTSSPDEEEAVSPNFPASHSNLGTLELIDIEQDVEIEFLPPCLEAEFVLSTMEPEFISEFISQVDHTISHDSVSINTSILPPIHSLPTIENIENLTENLPISAMNNNTTFDTDSSTSVDGTIQPIISKKRLKNKLRRAVGSSYVGQEMGKLNFKKPPRKMKPRCGHRLVEKKTDRSYLCHLINDNQRNIIFEHFWKLKTWPEKKAYIRGMVTTRMIRRRRPGEKTELRKKEGHDLFLPTFNGEKVKVCREFFLNTLCLGQDSFRRWVKNYELGNVEKISEEISEEDQEENERQRTKRQKTLFKNKLNLNKEKTVELSKNVNEWLALLPKVPSHYCRSSTKNIYVEATFRSELNMYNVFKKWTHEVKVLLPSVSFFKKILKQNKIKIHSPRKDQCDTCCGYNVKTVTEQEYRHHVAMKNEAREAKNMAKQEASDTHLVITMDLQSVLLCPKTEASAMYYKQKLQVHNFTVYELNNKDVTLYVWHEVDGGVTANEFTSCIIDFLCSKLGVIKKFTLISDGCNYQNRNKVLASALSNFAVANNVVVQQLFLEKGHTMMECDSVHATLENYFVPPLNSPSDYIAQMRVARPKQPYFIKDLDYRFFKKFENASGNIQSLRPGKKVGDPVVTDIRALLYTCSGDIMFKLRHSATNFEKLSVRRNGSSTANIKIEPLYKNPLPINESKWRCLQDLKSVINKDHHSFYDSLPFKKDSLKK